MQNAWKYLLIALVSVVAYYGVLDYDLVKCDDNRIVKIYDDPVVKNQSYFFEFTQPYLNTTYYRPIVNMSFKADAEVHGKKYHKYHITNLLLHIVFCSLLFYAVRKFSDSEYLALATSMIFAVHPMFANAVAWLPGRNDILLGIFGLSAFISLYQYIETKKIPFLAANAAALLLALFSKETAAILPILFFVYMFLNNKDFAKSKSGIMIYAAWLAVGIFWFVLRSMAETGHDANVFSISVFLSNLRAIPEYIAKFFVPVSLSVLPTYSTIATIIGSVILALIAGLSFTLTKDKRKYALWGILWFLLLILPTTIFERANASEWNDYLYCRAYLPMAGILLSIVMIAGKYMAKVNKNIILGAGGILSLLLLIVNTNYAPAYSNIETFYNNAIRHDSTRAFFYEVIGVHYSKEKQFDKALQYYELAQKAEPTYYKRNFQVAQAAMYLRDFDKAISHFKKALELSPDNTNIIFSMATAYDYGGNVEKAIECYKEGLKIDPTMTDAYFELLFDYQRVRDFKSYDSLMQVIIERKYQSPMAAKRYDEIADQSFRNYNIDNANQLWKYAYAFDTTNIYYLKKITAAYYMQANEDSCRKYYRLFKKNGGRFNRSEVEKFSNLIGNR